MAFDNRLVTVDLTAEEVLQMLDLSCGSVGGGGFLQVAALEYTCDLTRGEGSRAVDVRFTAGTPETDDDVPIEVAENADQTTIRVITNHFTAEGGDGYDVLAGKTPTTLVNEDEEPVFYEQAFREYLESFPVAGDPALPTIPASDPRYAAEAGEGRITILGGPGTSVAPSHEPVAFVVTSDAFADGEAIPERYTCDGENLSPPLAWEGVPEGTESLAIIVADPNADGWAHWVAFDIEPSVGALAEGASGSDEFGEGMNDYPVAGWAGPCPPEGAENTYGFGLFALDTTLALDETATAADLRAAMDGHILARTELSGTRAR
jgi:Raf kinase inhibitor-like YbhB/YbcL family protein